MNIDWKLFLTLICAAICSYLLIMWLHKKFSAVLMTTAKNQENDRRLIGFNREQEKSSDAD